jgi:signal transduction histidine kinase
MRSQETFSATASLFANVDNTSELSHLAWHPGDFVLKSLVLGAVAHPLAPSLGLTLRRGRFVAVPSRMLGPLRRSDTSFVEPRETDDLVSAAAVERDRVIAILMHELRTPLTTLMISAELLKHETLDINSTRRVAAIVDRQVRAMTRLIGDALPGSP